MRAVREKKIIKRKTVGAGHCRWNSQLIGKLSKTESGVKNGRFSELVVH